MTEPVVRIETAKEQAPQDLTGPALSPFRQFLRRFRHNRLAVWCLVVIAFLAILALLWSGDPIGTDLKRLPFGIRQAAVAINAVRTFPYNPSETHLKDQLRPPCRQYLLGTDELGRDVLSRMLHGTRVSLTIGFVAVGIAITIGIVVGAFAGYFAGWTDTVLMRFVDIMMNFPTFFLVVTVIALLDNPSFWWIIVVIGLTGWTGTARLVRAEFLSMRQQDYVVAVQSLGAGNARIMFKHILPNAVAPVLVSATLGVAGAILTEAGLSFLGFGVRPPQATWGNILTAGRNYFLEAPWLFLFPGVAILVTVLAFNLLGEGLRDALNPKLSEGGR